MDASCAPPFAAREEKIGDPRTLSDLVGKEPLILSAFEETILAEVQRLEALAPSPMTQLA